MGFNSGFKGLNRHRGETAITSTLEMGGCHSPRSGRFPPGVKKLYPCTQCTGGWVDLGVGLEVHWKFHPNLDFFLPVWPARSSSLYRLRYRPSRLPSEILITINSTFYALEYKIQRNSIKFLAYVFQPIHTNHRRTICTSWKVQKLL